MRETSDDGVAYATRPDADVSQFVKPRLKF